MDTRLSVVTLAALAFGLAASSEEPKPADPAKPSLEGRIMDRSSGRRAVVDGGGTYQARGTVPVGQLTVARPAAGGRHETAVLGLRDLDVNVEAEGLIARTTVRHVFLNETTETLEGVFTFALPPGVAVDRFAMTIQSESDLMEGSLVDRGEAKRIYTDLVYGRSIDPGVLEWLDERTFRATIFPIPPRGTKTIVISYLDTLTQTWRDGVPEWRYRFPLTARGEGAQAVPPAARLRLYATLRGLPASAPVHGSLGSEVIREANRQVTVAAAMPGAAAKEDWEFAWPVPDASEAGTPGCVAQVHRPKGAIEGTFVLALSPDAAPPPSSEPQDVLLLLDTSASRTQREFGAAVEFIEGLLRHLRPGDRFGVVAFDVLPRVLPGGLREATDANVAATVAFLKSKTPLGSTDLAAAFAALPASFGKELRSRVQVVLVGDAEATSGRATGEAVLKEAHAVLADLDAEIHAVWPGPGAEADGRKTADDQRALLARFSGGAVTCLGRDERPAEAGRRVATSLLATPLLRRAAVTVKLPGESAAEVVVPHLGDGLALHGRTFVFGRYAKPGLATVTLTGEVRSREFSRAWTVELPALDPSNAAVVKLWARAKMGELYESGGSSGTAQMAREHRLLTRETAFLVLESEELYRQFHVERFPRNPLGADELRSRFVAGTPVRPWEKDSGGGGVAGLQQGLRTRQAGLPGQARSLVEIGGTVVRSSILRAEVPAVQQEGQRALTPAECLDRRVKLTRLIAADRSLPFEPETTFTTHWMQAWDASLREMATAWRLFAASSDEGIWRIVNTQPDKAPDSWESADQPKDPGTPGVTVAGRGPVSGLGGASGRRPVLVSNVPGGMVGASNLAPRTAQLVQNEPVADSRPPAGGTELMLLTNPSAPTRMQVSPDGLTLEFESHLAAHQLLGVVLYGRPADALRFAATGDLRRALELRAKVTYALGRVTPERQAAAWNLLAEQALLEGRPQAARQAAGRALRALEEPHAAYAIGTPRLSLLLAALSAEMNFDFAAAAAHYRPLLASWTLPRENMTAVFDTLLSVMVQAGDCSGASEVLKSKWNGQKPGDGSRYRDLGRFCLALDQVEEAIRAFSSMAEFDPKLGTACDSPQDFLKLK